MFLNHEASEPHHGEGTHTEHEEHTGPTVVLFVIFGLLMGGIMR